MEVRKRAAQLLYKHQRHVQINLHLSKLVSLETMFVVRLGDGRGRRYVRIFV